VPNHTAAGLLLVPLDGFVGGPPAREPWGPFLGPIGQASARGVVGQDSATHSNAKRRVDAAVRLWEPDNLPTHRSRNREISPSRQAGVSH
jgi:hypothetical protein